jgi:hypothetical protein
MERITVIAVDGGFLVSSDARRPHGHERPGAPRRPSGTPRRLSGLPAYLAALLPPAAGVPANVVTYYGLSLLVIAFRVSRRNYRQRRTQKSPPSPEFAAMRKTRARSGVCKQ